MDASQHTSSDRRPSAPAAVWRAALQGMRRPLLRALLLALGCLAIAPAALPAQRSADEATGIVNSLAKTIYYFAWPTATYEYVTLRDLQRVAGGWDVPIRLSGRSAFDGGVLWLELVVELRDGALHNVRLGADNHELVPPFATFATTMAITAAVIEQQAQESPQVRRPQQGEALAPRYEPRRTEPQRVSDPAPRETPWEHDRRDADMLVGRWQDENSVFTYYANGRMTCWWDDGYRMSGSWSIRSDTLVWEYDDGKVEHYLLESLRRGDHRFRSLEDGRVWYARRIR